MPAHVLPSGHAVYVNAASPPPPKYSYATIQYHQHPQHIVHQTIPGGGPPPPNQQYMSIVPVQGGVPPGHVQSMDPRGGSYTFWQSPDEHQGGPHTVTIVGPGVVRPGGVPMKVVQQMGGAPSSKSGATESHHKHKQKQRQGASSLRKDKNGKGQRNNGRNNSRGGGSGGGETKPPSASHNSVTNSLLDDYKAKKNNRDWTALDIKGHVVEFCQDQNGSRFIQQRLEIGDASEKEIVIIEVLPEVDRLRNDVFGNYVVQKLFGFGTDKMKEDLRDTIMGEMVQLSMQMYG